MPGRETPSCVTEDLGGLEGLHSSLQVPVANLGGLGLEMLAHHRLQCWRAEAQSLLVPSPQLITVFTRWLQPHHTSPKHVLQRLCCALVPPLTCNARQYRAARCSAGHALQLQCSSLISIDERFVRSDPSESHILRQPVLDSSDDPREDEFLNLHVLVSLGGAHTKACARGFAVFDSICSAVTSTRKSTETLAPGFGWPGHSSRLCLTHRPVAKR